MPQLHAQNSKVVSDFRWRAGFSAEKPVAEIFAFLVDSELVMQKNGSQVAKYNGELGFAYSPFSFITFETGYQLAQNRKAYSSNFKTTHRLAFSAEAKTRIDRFRLAYRIRYQTIDDDMDWAGNDFFNSHVVKARFRAKYNIRKKKVNPFFSSEIYVQGLNGRFDATKLKTLAGFEYRINKRKEINLYYRSDYELSSLSPFSYHTLGVNYSLKF